MIDYIITTSALRKCIITIIYLKGRKITERNIKVIDNGNTTIKAYCYLRKQTRVFKKENILSAAFYTPHGVKTDIFENASYAAV